MADPDLVNKLLNPDFDWNQFRASLAANTPLLDLTNTDLFGRSLVNLNLSGCNFSGSTLTNTDLSGSTFERSDLRAVGFSGAKLVNTVMKNAMASFCDFRNAVFSGTDLTAANLQFADMTGADLRSSIVDEANALCADLDVSLLPKQVSLPITVGPSVKMNLEGTLFEGAFVRMDARGVDSFTPQGGGIVNTQKGAGSFEGFHIQRVGHEQEFRIESLAFSGRFLRIDGTKLTPGMIGGVVNCQAARPGGHLSTLERIALRRAPGFGPCFTIGSAVTPNCTIGILMGALEPLPSGSGVVSVFNMGVTMLQLFKIPNSPLPPA